MNKGVHQIVQGNKQLLVLIVYFTVLCGGCLVL